MSSLLTRKEVAERLRVSVRKLQTGWGPTPHPAYERPVMYHVDAVEAFENQWQSNAQEVSTRTTEPETGSSDSAPMGKSTDDPHLRKIKQRLKEKRAASGRKSNRTRQKSQSGAA